LPFPEEKEIVRRLISENEIGKKIKYITFDKNIGYANGNNFLIKTAFLMDNFDYILISNPDIRIIDDNVLNELVKKMEIDNKIGIIGQKF
jgi:GT2 family glycosyltransferase